MRTGIYSSPVLCCLFAVSVFSATTRIPWERRGSDPLNIDWSPAPSPQDGPPLDVDALRNPAYLPAQIGGIVGSYALSLVLVAIILLALAKTRREHLRGAEELDLEEPTQQLASLGLPPYQSQPNFAYPPQSPKSPTRNFSYPAPLSPVSVISQNFYPSPVSSFAPGIDLTVDQSVVAADKRMAQQQLEEMYKYVMEHEDAKEAGKEAPPISYPQSLKTPSTSTTTFLKQKNKPAGLNLSKDEKTQSRTSSILSALKSPRKKAMKGVSISSPIMTPMSGTFPRGDSEEMGPISPRHYAPPAPPPIPSEYAGGHRATATGVSPITPDISPQSTQSIDERIRAQLGQQNGHYRTASQAPSEPDPISAVSERSTAPLIGLPSSPKPGARFSSLPSLPSSPRPGQGFQRANAPSAVRTGGALPLRAYEPSIRSPTTIERHTKQTVFERNMPLSPGAQTPWTGAPVPYTPYQPYTPVIPITPSLVTKADRKKMRRFEPKTPTVEMVQNEEDVW